MANLSEEIGRICNILEDSVEEQDWNLVKKMIDDLNDVYEHLDREENGYVQDYEQMIINIDIKPPKRVEKLWGYELWIHNDEEYCGKSLVFPKKGNHFSMHYHLKKKETWYIQQGSFQFNWIDVENGKHDSKIVKEGDSVLIERGQPHQLIALENDSIVFEVSTQHFDEDSYRIYRETPNDLL